MTDMLTDRKITRAYHLRALRYLFRKRQLARVEFRMIRNDVSLCVMRRRLRLLRRDLLSLRRVLVPLRKRVTEIAVSLIRQNWRLLPNAYPLTALAGHALEMAMLSRAAVREVQSRKKM